MISLEILLVVYEVACLRLKCQTLTLTDISRKFVEVHDLRKIPEAVVMEVVCGYGSCTGVMEVVVMEVVVMRRS